MTSGAIDHEIASCLSEELSALEQLRALLQGNDEVSIPGVVVAGAQSAGKSSVLEALGGMKLPRGQNITTRVPLVLSLVTVPGVVPHAVISGDADLATNGMEINIQHVSDEIEQLTNELAGDGSAVSAKPIYLKILRPSGPTLTLIDLPGITHNSADGTQDIHTETVDLVKKFISEENMVILVVVPAMDDFANAEAIALAKKYDPDGRRTLGVVTKTDNVQAGSGIKSKLRMEVGHVQLSLGFIAVVNRTPIQVEEDTPAEMVRAREKDFFTTNAEVAELEKEFWGFDTLVERIVAIQAERVREFIPKFLSQSARRVKELKRALRDMPKVYTTVNELWEAYRKIISAIREELKDLLTGGSDGAIIGQDPASSNIIPHVTGMYKAYSAGIMKDVIPDFFSDDYFQKARAAFKRVDGMALSNLLAGRVFNALFREVFSGDLADRSEDLVEGVKAFMQQTLGRLCDRACSAHPVLLNELKDNLVEQFIDAMEARAKKAVANIVEAELGWVFTQDALYEDTMRRVHAMVNAVRKSRVEHQATAGSDDEFVLEHVEDVGSVPKDFISKMIDTTAMSEEDVTRDLQVTIHAYSDVVCRRLFDSVPKQIHRILVNGISDGFVEWMLDRVNESDLQRWLAEDSLSQRKRKELESKLSQFQEAVVILKSAGGRSK
eukprot:g16826.t1